MSTKYKYLWLLLIFVGFIACENDDLVIAPDPIVELPALQTGSLDLSKYVAVGASFTAGFSDGALFIASQENSFPNILSQQFAMANGGAFTQPLMSDNVGGLLFGGNQIAGPRKIFNLAGESIDDVAGTPTTEITAGTPGPYSNMGVPGAKSFHLLFDGYGNPGGLLTDPATANPYYVRMASSPTATMLGDAMAQSPTFFTLSEIGGNDVLGYALSGGDGTNTITPSAGPPGVGFDQTFGALVATLTGGGAKGLVTNVPKITDLPHFTTVPFAPLDPTNETFGPLIPTLNTVYGALNGVYAFLQFQGAITDAATRTISFSTSAASAVVIKDENLDDLSAQIAGVLSASPQFAGLLASFGLPTDAGTVGAVAGLFGATFGQSRQATADDLLVLTSSSIIGTVNTDVFAFLQSQGLPAAVAGQFAVEGVTLPLSDKWVLTPQEQDDITIATDAYNVTIAAVASANANVALVDFRDLLTEASSTSGLSYENFTLTTDLVFGGLVSLDGFHLTAKGYALMATVFLDALDENFGSNFIEAGAFPRAVDYPAHYPAVLP
jgi:hypothetical protein